MSGKAAVLNALLKRLYAQAHALLLHYCRAEGGKAVHAAALHALHVRHAAGKAHRKQVHHKAGVYARTEYGYAVGLGQFIHFLRKLGLICLWIAHLLRRADNVYAVFDHKLYLREHLFGEGIRSYNAYVRRAARRNLVYIVADRNVPALSALNAKQFKYALAYARGVNIAHSGYFNAFFFKQNLGYSAAHRAEAPYGNPDIVHSSPSSVIQLFF